MRKQYAISEIFYSLQGEGVRAGCPSVFVRFAGCNLACTVDTVGFDCDTDFKAKEKLTFGQIVDRCRSMFNCGWLVLTGGEPTLQVDREFIIEMQNEGFSVAMETNGTNDIGGLDWLTVSPKKDDLITPITGIIEEVKYVRSYGQQLLHQPIKALHYLVSPAFDGSALDSMALQWCIDLVKENPEWRLSVQQHKQWKIQ